MKQIILKCLQMQAQVRVLHWETSSYPEHMAFGQFYDAVDPLVDKLVEVIQGRYQKIMFGGIENIQVADYNALKLHLFLEDMKSFFSVRLEQAGLNKETDADIYNIAQEITAEIEKLKYLLTLK
jgi:hypothetical protein